MRRSRFVGVRGRGFEVWHERRVCGVGVRDVGSSFSTWTRGFDISNMQWGAELHTTGGATRLSGLQEWRWLTQRQGVTHLSTFKPSHKPINKRENTISWACSLWSSGDVVTLRACSAPRVHIC